MSKAKPLFAESTDVPVGKSIGEILALLVRAGAVSVNQELEAGEVTGLSFVIPMGAARIPFRLPVRIEPVFRKLNGARSEWGQFSQATMQQKDLEQAKRVAWRQLYWWLKSQLALIDLGMVETVEVMMPYMLNADGRTFFDTYRQRLVAGPSKTDEATS